MFAFFAYFLVLESFPTVRRRVYASKPSCQEFEMQTLETLTYRNEQPGLGEKGNIRKSNDGVEKKNKRATDPFAADIAASKRLWREWWA
jgi:hypothetical protein